MNQITIKATYCWNINRDLYKDVYTILNWILKPSLKLHLFTIIILKIAILDSLAVGGIGDSQTSLNWYFFHLYLQQQVESKATLIQSLEAQLAQR